MGRALRDGLELLDLNFARALAVIETYYVEEISEMSRMQIAAAQVGVRPEDVLSVREVVATGLERDPTAPAPVVDPHSDVAQRAQAAAEARHGAAEARPR